MLNRIQVDLMYKQAIVVRKDLEMSRGKTAAQVAHASVGAWKNADRRAREVWEKEGSKKVVLQADGVEEILDIKQRAGRLPTKMIKDAGRTEVPAGTITCLAVGPAEEREVDKLTGHLKLLK